MSEPQRCERCGSSLLQLEGFGERCLVCLFEAALESSGSVSTDAPAEDNRTGHPIAIGRYTIVRVMGEGGMGVVYEAEQDHPRRTVALKIMKPGIASPETVVRFEREAQALGRLQHPGIAQIYEAGTANTGFGPQPYFAMELIRGLPPGDYVARHKLGVRARLELVAKTAEAVHHAHQRGLIHRDLKPSNILVDESGQPKVLDFGVARAIDDNKGQQNPQTDVGQVVGTLAYMSPEQVLADPHEIDTRTDVYALGVILYELVAQRLPYNASNMHEAIKAIGEDDPTMLGTLDRFCKGDIETIAAKALDKDKTRRYTSSAELAADIRRYLTDQPIVARPPTATYQLKKFARRNRALVAGTVAVFAVLVAGVIVSSWQAARAMRAERAALDERDHATSARAEATAQRNAALDAEQVATNERNRAVAAEMQVRQERHRITWQNLARESLRLSALRSDDDLAALLARQSFLWQQRESNPSHSEFVENALQEAGSLTLWSHNFAHTYGVWIHSRALAFSPDGSLVATAGPDGSILLWDMKRRGSSPRVLKGRPGLGAVLFVAFSPDGSRLASGGFEDSGVIGNVATPAPVKIWDLRESNPSPVLLRGHRSEVNGGAFSPDGTTLVTADCFQVCDTESTILLWDLRSLGNPGRPIEPVKLGNGSFAAFSRDGVWLVGVGGRGSGGQIWDMRSPARPSSSLPAPLPGLNAAFSPDSKHLALGARSGVYLFDLQNRTSPRVLFQGGFSVTAFSPDGKRLAAGSFDNMVRIWDMGDVMAAPLVLRGHQAPVAAIAFSPDGALVVSNSDDGTVRAWDLQSPGMNRVLSHDSRRIPPAQGSRGGNPNAQVVAFAPNGNRLLAGKMDGSVHMWDLQGPETSSGVIDGNLGLAAIRPMVFSRDASRFATGGGTDGVEPRVWDLKNPSASPEAVRVGNTRIQDLLFSPNGSELAMTPQATDSSAAVLLWNLRTSTMRIFPLPNTPLDRPVPRRLEYSPDATRLAVSNQSAVSIWDLRDSNLPPIVLQTRGRQPIFSLAFSPDGGTLAAGAEDATLWNLLNPKAPPVVLPGIGNFPIFGIEISPDGTRLVTSNEFIRLWDLRNPNQKPVSLAISGRGTSSLAFSPDSSRLAVAQQDGSVRLFLLGAAAAAHLCTRVWRNLSMEEWLLYIGDGIPYERTCPALPPGYGVPNARSTDQN